MLKIKNQETRKIEQHSFTQPPYFWGDQAVMPKPYGCHIRVAGPDLWYQKKDAVVEQSLASLARGPGFMSVCVVCKVCQVGGWGS